MKKYKFLFLVLLFGLFFVPKDVFAKTEVRLLKGDYTELARCTDDECINGTFYADVGPVKRIMIVQDGYVIPADMKYSWYLDFSISYTPSSLRALGVRVGQSGNSWLTPSWSYEVVNSYFDSVYGSPTNRYHVNATFTTLNQGDTIFTDIELGEDIWLYNFTLYAWRLTATGSGTGDIIFNQTQELIDNADKNTHEIINNANKNHEEAEETRKGIWDTIKDLPNQFGNLLKNLFIPDDNYFSDKFDELTQNVEDVLGFLAYPFTLTIKTFEFFLTVEDSGNYVIKWDDVKVPNFENHTIIKKGSFDFATLLEDTRIASLRNIAFVFINALLLLAFLQLCKNKYNQVFGGEVSEVEFISVAEEYDIDYKTGEISNIKHIEKKTTRRDVS